MPLKKWIQAIPTKTYTQFHGEILFSQNSTQNDQRRENQVQEKPAIRFIRLIQQRKDDTLINKSINPSNNKPFDKWNESMNQPVNQSIKQLIDQTIVY